MVKGGGGSNEIDAAKWDVDGGAGGVASIGYFTLLSFLLRGLTWKSS